LQQNHYNSRKLPNKPKEVAAGMRPGAAEAAGRQESRGIHIVKSAAESGGPRRTEKDKNGIMIK